MVTVCATGSRLMEKLLPWYTAAIVCVPTVKFVVVSVAVPACAPQHERRLAGLAAVYEELHGAPARDPCTVALNVTC